MSQIRYFVTDDYGRTIIEDREFYDLDEARAAARQLSGEQCGVWVCPSRWDDSDGGYVGIGADEEIQPGLKS